MSVLKRYILIAVALFTVANLNAQKFSFAYLSDTHIAVGADSVKELAKLRNISADTIYNVMYHSKVKGFKRCKYIKIELEED